MLRALERHEMPEFLGAALTAMPAFRLGGIGHSVSLA